MSTFSFGALFQLNSDATLLRWRKHGSTDTLRNETIPRAQSSFHGAVKAIPTDSTYGQQRVWSVLEMIHTAVVYIR